MLLHHPRLMEKVFLDSEVNIASTMQVLEKEIGLDREDVIQMQLQKGVTSVLSYPRSELRKRILVYKKDLGYGEDEMRDMVRRDPRMLQTNSIKVKKLLKILREELGIGSGDVKEMLQKEILLLTYDAEKNIRPTIQYLKNGPVGRCLGMVERKGESTLLDNQTVEEKEELIRGRVKTLIMGHPKVLSCSLERNLKPTVEFFWGSNCTSSTSVVGLTDYEFGKVLYRRGGSLLEANVERTLSKKVNFLREHFGLDVGEECKDGDGDVDNAADDDYSLVDKVQMWNGCKVEIPLPRSLLVPKKDENGVSEPKSSLTPYESKRLLAQMIATTPDILTLSIDTNLKPKFDFFANILKLETDELRYIMLKRPQLLSLSLDRNILPKIDFFLKERRPTALSVLNGQESYDGGLGMTLKEVRNWIVRHPQILTFSLEKRIRPRVVDIVRYNLQVGDEEGDAPLNCISRGEQSWKQWIQSNVV
jgi:mTERF.